MDKNPLFRGKLKICWTWSPLFPGVKLGAKGEEEEEKGKGREKKKKKGRKKRYTFMYFTF